MSSRRVTPEIVALVILAPLVVLGASGWLMQAIFGAATPAKYALTVAVPLLLVLLAVTRHRFLVLVALTVVAAPLAGLRLFALGGSVDVFAAIVVAAAVPLFLGLTRPVGRSASGRVLPIAALLTLIPLFRGTDVLLTVSVALAAAAVAFLCARAAVLPGGPAVVVGSVLVSAALQAGLAIWEYATRQDFSRYTGPGSFGPDNFFDYQGQPRPSGLLPDPISLGTVLMVAVPVGLVVLVVLIGRRRAVPAATVAVCLVATGVGLALSLSRMPALGALAGLVVVAVVAPRGWRRRLAGSAGVLVAVLVAGAVAIGGPSLVERASSVADPTAAGVATAQGDRDREAYWRVAVETAGQHPIAGVGAGNLNERLLAEAPNAGPNTHAHSAYLQILAESGLLGAAAVLLLAGALIADLRRARRRAPMLSAGVAGAMAAVAVAATTDVVVLRWVAVAAALAPLAGLIAGLAALDRAAEDPAPEPAVPAPAVATA